MNKKLLLALLVSVLLLPLFAENTYPIQYSLKGYYPLRENKIDVMKFTRGLSISERKGNIIKNFKFNTREVVDIEDSLVVIVAEYRGIEFPQQVILTFDQLHREPVRNLVPFDAAEAGETTDCGR